MTVQLSEFQVDKFRGLGKAARTLAQDFKDGKGPDPTSGSTYKGGVPQCTWGQLLDKAGFKPAANLSSGDNLGVFAQYIGEPKVKSAQKVGSVQVGLMSDKVVEYDIKKIAEYGTKIMRANDPATSAAARKAATWKLLDELASEIESVFGEPSETEFVTFETAAEQHLQNLIMGTE
jgi:hypothetical protein